MKKQVLKSDIRKMGLTSEELRYSCQLQDSELSRIYFKYTYSGPADCIPSMYAKAVVYFAKEYIQKNGFNQASFTGTASYVAEKFDANIDAIERTLKGIAISHKCFIISLYAGLDTITIK